MAGRCAALLLVGGLVIGVCGTAPAKATGTNRGTGISGGSRWGQVGRPRTGGARSGERPASAAPGGEVPAGTAISGFRYLSARRISSGVTLRALRVTGIKGPVRGALVEVDLRDRHVSVGLLSPPVIAARRTVSAMVRARGAVAGVNGDFFNIRESHAGIRPTGSSSGPVVDRGRALKAAVPTGQRFGPAPPPGSSAETVIGIRPDRIGRVSWLHLTGWIRFADTELPLLGLNQYALPMGGAGAFTSAWGNVSRKRAVCGSDVDRRDPCSIDTTEVVVRDGTVAKVRSSVHGGVIPAGTTVLVGREEAAAALRTLRPGDHVEVDYRLSGPEHFRFAVGGVPILQDGVPVFGLSQVGSAPRTAAGFSRDGRRMYLVVVDGRSARSHGLTLAELAVLLAQAGADDAVDLDGGGSSTLAVRGRGGHRVRVRNRPSEGRERAVANGIGVFTPARPHS